MDGRERLRAIFAGELPDRVGFEDAYWNETIERWHAEGLPPDVHPCVYFDTDSVNRASPIQTFLFPERVIEENDEYTIRFDAEGVTRKDFKAGRGWIPQRLSTTLRSASDWWELKERLRPSPERIVEHEDGVRRSAGHYRFLGAHEPFETACIKAGHERVLGWMAEDPGLVRDIFETLTELIIDLHGLMKDRGIECDGVGWAGDMSCTRSPMFSPAMYRELLLPSHRRLCDYFHTQGMPSYLHSDGNVKPLIPLIVEAGFDALNPLEAKAGLDVRELKRVWGDRLVLVGNIDVRVMARTKPEIEREVREKLLVAKEGGGYIYHSDHSVPPDVSFENYRYVYDLVMTHGGY